MSGYRALSQSIHQPLGMTNNSLKQSQFEQEQQEIYEGYTADDTPPASRCFKSRDEGCCCCRNTLCSELSFSDPEMNQLFRRYVYTFHKRLLNRFIILQIIVLLFMAAIEFAYHLQMTYRDLVLISIITCYLLLFVYVNCRCMQRTHVPLIVIISVILIVAFLFLALPVHWFSPYNPSILMSYGNVSNAQTTPNPTSLPIASTTTASPLYPSRSPILLSLVDGLWESIFVIASIYCLLPIRSCLALCITSALSLIYVLTSSLCTGVVAVCSANQPPVQIMWQAALANILIHVCCHVIGLLQLRFQERNLRQAFLDTRQCVANRLTFQEENDRLERLVKCLVPEPLIPDMRRDFMQGTIDWKVPVVVHLRNISLLSVEICGLSCFHYSKNNSLNQEDNEPKPNLTSDAIRLFNQLFAKCDQLAEALQCFRVRLHGDEMLYLAGYPQTRVDHAKCSVELAHNIVDTINNLCESANIQLDVRCAVHTGEAFAAVLGNSRMIFDILGDDILYVRQLQALCTPGRVLVSKPSFDQLPDGYRTEPGPLQEQPISSKHSVYRLDTFYIHSKLKDSRNASNGGPNILQKLSSPNHKQSRHATNHRFVSEPPNQRATHISKLSQLSKFNVEIPFVFLTSELHNKEDTINSDFIRKPFKRTTAHNVWRDALHRYMAETLEVTDDQPIGAIRAFSMHPITCRFKDANKEKEFYNQSDFTFGRSMMATLLLLIGTAAIQTLVFPRTMLLLMLFMIALTWIGVMLLIVVATRMKCLEFNIQSAMTMRTVAAISSVLFVYAVSQVNVICCGMTSLNQSIVMPSIIPSNILHIHCPFPQYVAVSCALSLLLLVVFTALPFLAKLSLTTIIVLAYTVVLEAPLRSMFTAYDDATGRTWMPTHMVSLICEASFFILVVLHSRFVEYVRRLGYLWKSQACCSLDESENIRESSMRALKTMLPNHVVNFYMDSTYRHSKGIYSQEFDCVGVLCVSVPTWCPVGLVEPTAVAESIRGLNQVICAFDQLIQDDKFRDVMKIRSIGDMSMYASGMDPQSPITDNATMVQRLTQLVQLALAFRQTAADVNKRLMEERLRLRIGMHAGAGFCGVTGGSRPTFGLWGEAVQVAALLEKCARLGDLQVTQSITGPVPVPVPLPSPPSHQNSTGGPYEWQEGVTLALAGGQLCPVPPGGPLSGSAELLLRIYQLRDLSILQPLSGPRRNSMSFQQSNVNPGFNHVSSALHPAASQPIVCHPASLPAVSIDSQHRPLGTPNFGIIPQHKLGPQRPTNIVGAMRHPPPNIAPPPPGQGVTPAHNYQPARSASHKLEHQHSSSSSGAANQSNGDLGHKKIEKPNSLIQSSASNSTGDHQFPPLTVSPPIGYTQSSATQSIPPPVPVHHHQASSPSSVNTFLALEAQCANTESSRSRELHLQAAAPGPPPVRATSNVSNTPTRRTIVQQMSAPAVASHLFSQKEEDEFLYHHNPLYTDNEYESMAESQSNLLEAIPLVEKPVNNKIDSITAQNPKHSPLKALHRASSNERSTPPVLPPKPGQNLGNSGRTSDNSPRLSIGSNNRSASGRDEYFDFPDYKRPSSPQLRAKEKLSSSLSPRGKSSPQSGADSGPVSPPSGNADVQRASHVIAHNNLSNQHTAANMTMPLILNNLESLQMGQSNKSPTLPNMQWGSKYSYPSPHNPNYSSPEGPSSGNAFAPYGVSNRQSVRAQYQNQPPPLLPHSDFYEESDCPEEEMSDMETQPQHYDRHESGCGYRHHDNNDVMTRSGGGAESCVSLVADSNDLEDTSCDEGGVDSDIDAMRVQSDLMSEVSDNPLVSDLDDESYLLGSGAVNHNPLFRFPAHNLMNQHRAMNDDLKLWESHLREAYHQSSSFPHHQIHPDLDSRDDEEPLMAEHKGRIDPDITELYSDAITAAINAACSSDAAGNKPSASSSALPPIAAVGLPDFSRILSGASAIVSDSNANNPVSQSPHQSNRASLDDSSGDNPKNNNLKHPESPAPLVKPSQIFRPIQARFQNNNASYADRIGNRGKGWSYGGASSPDYTGAGRRSMSGMESDAMSGYTGDVASSAYDSEEDMSERDEDVEACSRPAVTTADLLMFSADPGLNLFDDCSNGQLLAFPHLKFGSGGPSSGGSTGEHGRKQNSDVSNKRSDYDNLESDASDLIKEIRYQSSKVMQQQLLSGQMQTASPHKASSSAGSNSSEGHASRQQQQQQLAARILYQNLANYPIQAPVAPGRSHSGRQHPKNFNVFNEEIAAEARRISSVFRQQSFTYGDESDMELHHLSAGGEGAASPLQDDFVNVQAMNHHGGQASLINMPPLLNGQAMNGQPSHVSREPVNLPQLTQKQREFLNHARHFPQLTGASRLGRNRSRRGLAAPYVNLSGSTELGALKRSHSMEALLKEKPGSESRASTNTDATNGEAALSQRTGCGIDKLVSRMDRVRNLLPAELHSYVLPGCISSSSLASSVSCLLDQQQALYLHGSDPGGLANMPDDSEYDNYRSDWCSDDDLSCNERYYAHHNFTQALIQRAYQTGGIDAAISAPVRPASNSTDQSHHDNPNKKIRAQSMEPSSGQHHGQRVIGLPSHKANSLDQGELTNQDSNLSTAV